MGNGDTSRDRVLVLVTDGQVGNEDQILRELHQRLAGLRIFTVGSDTAVNAGFLRRLAAAGGGAMELVESEDRLDEVMSRFQRRIGTPVLTQLSLEPTGCEVQSETVTPARLHDLFVGAPVVIQGSYRGRPGSITLRGIDASGDRWSTVLQPGETSNRTLPAQWARAQLRDLEDRYVVAPSPALEQTIVATSLRFGVMCRFTAFVAVDRSEIANRGGANAKQLQAVYAPAGSDMLKQGAKGGGRPGAADERSRAATGGFVAMAQAVAPAVGGAMNRTGPSGAPAAPSMASAAPPPSPAMAPHAPARRNAAAPKAKSKAALMDLGGDEGRAGALELAPYRARAAALADGLAHGHASSRYVALGTLVVQLAVLIEDLKSVEAPMSEVTPLVALLDELVAARTKAGGGEPEAFEARAEAVLRAYANGTGSQPPAKSGRSFWK